MVNEDRLEYIDEDRLWRETGRVCYKWRRIQSNLVVSGRAGAGTRNANVEVGPSVNCIRPTTHRERYQMNN